MKLDILALMAHPDDAELSCSGTIAAQIQQGKKVGIVDYTQGEMGTRGTIETRKQEASDASKILGLSARENLKFADVFFKNDREHQLKVVEVIRKYQPEIIIANAIKDRHPDHGRAAQLTIDACFMSGLQKVATTYEGKPQAAWRPKQVFHIIQSTSIEPDFVFDISNFWDVKVKSIQAYKTQFYNPDATDEEQTFISTPQFMKFLESRAREYGQIVGVEYAEAFTKSSQFVVNDLFHLI